MKITLGDIFAELPKKKAFKEGIRRAPKRAFTLSEQDTKLALSNALRYVPKKWHDVLAPEFLDELLSMGRIYGYRFRPEGGLKGKPIDEYEGYTLEGKAFQVMIDNNLDFDVALYPYELVTYGETGQVMQNWMQYQIIKKYLQLMNDTQTLVINSGHPLGLFTSSKEAPRVTLTNGLMVGQYDNLDDFNRASALGVASYGQMTAGGWMYIGPQGIVHGTYSTLLNAGRSKLGIPEHENLAGKLFVTSGLGGMSGAQGKAIEISGGVGIIAEVDPSRIETRYTQGWVSVVASSEEEAFSLALKAKENKEALAIAYHGNVVSLLEYAIAHDIWIDLLSDQTSCHAVYDGGYCPVTLTFDERTKMLKEDKEQFMKEVDKGLIRHYEAVKTIHDKGTYFFDYGNSFMKAIYDAGVSEICKNKENDLDGFIWPSYVEDIMGPVLFDYGYVPFMIYSNKYRLNNIDGYYTEYFSTIDILPTIANLFDLDLEYQYVFGQDAFSPLDYNKIMGISSTEPYLTNVIRFADMSFLNQDFMYTSIADSYTIYNEEFNSNYLLNLNDYFITEYIKSLNVLKYDYFQSMNPENN
ncbi:MAG: hypothetical protein ACVCEJ_09280 [Candidatus Izemoplasmataceae bacterium]